MTDAGVRVSIWDLPTRLVHWALVVLVPFSWWSAEAHHMDWHRTSGYFIIGLLVFRLIWGVAGSSTARFGGFVRGPRTAFAYARGQGERGLGHNPLGGWSVVAMLLLLVAQVGLGLFAVDTDGLESGPLSHWVSFDTGRSVAELHEINFKLLQAMILLHIAAILFYQLVRRENLIAPMIGGAKRLDAAPDSPPVMVPAGRAVLVALVAAGIAWWVSRGLPLAS